jgi:hypothetical protein
VSLHYLPCFPHLCPSPKNLLLHCHFVSLSLWY